MAHDACKQKKNHLFFQKALSIFHSILPFQRTNEIFIALVNKSRKRLRMRDERNVWRTVGAANFSKTGASIYAVAQVSVNIRN